MLQESYAFASIAVQHFIYAGILSSLFALVTIVYLSLLWGVAGTLSKSMAFMIHTLYLLWQSNVAFVAVVCLAVGRHNQEQSGEALQLWNAAPMMVPSAALLYMTMLVLSMAIIWQRGRSHNAQPGKN